MATTRIMAIWLTAPSHKPRNSKESHTKVTEKSHNLKILINLVLHDRIARLTLDTLILRGFTFGGKFKYREEHSRARLVVALVKRNSGSETPSIDSSFLNVEDKDILKEYAAGIVALTRLLVHF